MKKKIVYIDNFLSSHGSTPTTGATLTQSFIDEGYEVIQAGTKKNKVARLFEMLLAIIKNKNAVILIATYSTSAFYFAWACAQLCRMLGVTYIPCLHGGNLPGRIKNNPVLCDQVFGHSFTNVVVSGYLQQSVVENNWPSTLIPNSINVNDYPYLHRPAARPKLLWVRSFHKIYNPQLAVKVVYGLNKIFNDVTLKMVGPDKDGSLEDCKKLAGELGVRDKINFTGRLSPEEWARQSVDYDIFINTTNFDNLPVSVIEAMALGMPVVSTNVGGLKYLIENEVNGLLVNPGNEGEFIAAIKSLVADAGLVGRVSRQARESAAAFDVKRTMQLWNKLLTST